MLSLKTDQIAHVKKVGKLYQNDGKFTEMTDNIRIREKISEGKAQGRWNTKDIASELLISKNEATSQGRTHLKWEKKIKNKCRCNSHFL